MQKEVKKRQLEKYFSERFFIVLKSAEGVFSKDIAKELGCDRRKVSTWRQRWHENVDHFYLTIIEIRELLSNKDIIEKIKDL